MELRQKRRVIEEVAVYDSRTFYEDQSPKRSRPRGDRSVSPSVSPEPLEHRRGVPAAAVRIQSEPTPSTSAHVDQPSRTFAVTGSVHAPQDIEKVDVVEEEAPPAAVVTCVVQYRAPGGVDVSQGPGVENTSVTYVVHHTMPGKMALGDIKIRSNDTPYRDLRTDLAETPSPVMKKKGKIQPGDYGPVLETVTYVVCYQVGGPDDDDVINELHRPNYTITGRVGPTASIEDTAESYTLTGLSGGPPPYTEEQESLYLAILNYASRSQDDWHRELPAGRVTYITQQDFPKETDNTLSLTRKGPTIETTAESSPPPTPTPEDDDDEIWVKQKVVVVEPVRAGARLPTTTTADVFSEAMEIVEQADNASPPTTVRTEYRGWRRDDEVELKQPAADVVLPSYEVEICADVSAPDHREHYLATEASPADEMLVYRPDYIPDVVEVSEPLPKSSAHFTYQTAGEMPEVSGFSEVQISTTRAYLFHEQMPTIDVTSSGTEPLTSEVDVNTSPVAAYVQVTAAGSDTTSRTYVVHREWPSLKPPQTLGTQHGTLAEALVSDSSTPAGDVSTATYVVSYDWPTLAEPTAVFEAEREEEAGDVVTCPTPPSGEEVPRMYVVQRESPPPITTAGQDVAVPAKPHVGVDAGPDAEWSTLELPENCISRVYIVRRDWPALKVPPPELGRGMSVRLGTPSDIGPAPTGDVTKSSYVVHHDWPTLDVDLHARQPSASDVVGVPSWTEAEEVRVTAAATAAAAPPAGEVSQSYIVRYDLPADVAPKPRVTFAPTVTETDLDLIASSPDAVRTAPKITYEVKYDLQPERTTTALAASAAAVELKQPDVRVPEISVSAAGPDEGSYRVESAHDSDVERDWPWFKRDSPALRQKATTVPEVPPPVAVKVSSGVGYHGDGFHFDPSAEVPSRELMSKTYIVRRNWPELKLEMASRTTPDIGLTDVLMSDIDPGDITSRTYVVEWPPIKTRPAVTDDSAVDAGAFASAEDEGEMSPTYLARIERSRVKIHLPGPDRSREAEVEVIPPEPEEEPSEPAPSGDNIVSRTYIVYHDWPPGGLLLSEPKSDITDDDLFTSRQSDTVTYIVHFDLPTRKVKERVEESPEMFSVEPPDTDADFAARGRADIEFDTDVDRPARTIDDRPAVSFAYPPEPRRVEFEQRAVEVVTRREPQVRLRFETDIDEATGSGADDFRPTVRYDIAAAKFQPELEPIHVRQPAVAVVAQEPEINRRQRLETDIDLVETEPAVDVDVPIAAISVQRDRDKVTEPATMTVIAPAGDVNSRTYIVHHDWPKVKLTLTEPKRRLDAGLQVVPDDDADRQLVSRTYIVHYDWPTLKIQVPATEPPTRVILQEPRIGEEAAARNEPPPSVMFHYDVPEVEIEEPAPVRVREPSIEVIATRGDDVTDAEVGAAVAAPKVTYIRAGHEADITVAGDAASSGEFTSHTYIVHRDWPRVKLTLSQPKRTLAVSGGVGGDAEAESVSATLERKTYIVHYDRPTKTTEIVGVLPQRESFTEPQPPADEPITVAPTAVRDVAPEAEGVKYVVEYEIRRGKEPRKTQAVVAAEAAEVVRPSLPETTFRDEDTEQPFAAVVLVEPSADVVTCTYIVHNDWPRVKLTLSEPRGRIDARLRTESDPTTDREMVSRTYVVHYDWPSLRVKPIQPTQLAVRAAIGEPEDEREVTVRRETDVDDVVVAAAAREPFPSILVQHEVPEVKIHEPEPMEIPEPTVRAIAEPEPEVDLRLRYETDIDVAVAAFAAPAAAAPVAVTYADAGKDEHVEPAISIAAPAGDVVSRTYVVHHDWPKVKLTLTQPKRRFDAGCQVETGEETDRELVSRTYIVHYDWPTLKIEGPATEREIGEELAPGSEPLPSVVFHYDVPEVEIEEPEPVRVREPSLEVIAAPSVRDDGTEPAGAVTVIARSGDVVTRTYIVHHDWPKVKLRFADQRNRLDAGLRVESDTETGREMVSRTYIVRHDWPSLTVKAVEPTEPAGRVVIEEREIGEEVTVRGADVEAATVSERLPSAFVEQEIPEIQIQQPEPIEIPEPTLQAITQPGPEVDLRLRYETDIDLAVAESAAPQAAAAAVPVVMRYDEEGKMEQLEPAISIMAPSGDVVTRTYIVHYDWPSFKLTLSQPKQRLDAGLYADETDHEIVSRTYVVHYDWPSLKVKVVQPTESPARVAVEEPERGKEITVRDEEDIDVAAAVSEPLPSVRVQHEVPEVRIHEPEPTEIPEEPEHELDLRLRYETDIDVAVAEPAVTSAAAAAVPVAVTYVSEGKGEQIEPAISVIAPSGDVLTRTYVVHRDWPSFKLTLSQPKRRLDATGLHADETDREIVSRTYVVHYDWPSLKVKVVQPTEPSARVAIEEPDSGRPLPGVVVQHEVPEVRIQQPEPLEIPEPTVQAIGEPEPEVDLRLRYETDIDVAFAAPVVPPPAAVAVAPVAVTCVEEEHVEPAVAIVAPSEDTVAHTYIVHHDWPTVKLTLSEPKGKLGVPALTEDEGVSAPSSRVITVTYVVNWPSVKGETAEAGIEIQEQPRMPAAEPASVEIRVDEEPRPADIGAEPAVPGSETITYVITYDVGKKEAGKPAEVRVERRRSSVEEEPGAELKRPEVEVAGVAVMTPDVPATSATVTDGEEIVVAPVVSVAAGDTVSHTYVVHHDWPKVTLVAPVPKRPLAAAADADADTISRTYVVHYDWPAIQVRPPTTEPSAGAAIQAIDSGRDVSGDIEVGPAKPAVEKVTHTYIVHYDWPTGEVKVEKQVSAGELETALKTEPEVEVSVEKPGIVQPVLPEISLEIRRAQEPVLIETTVVRAPAVEEPELRISSEVTWPETDFTVKPPAVDIIPHFEVEAEPPLGAVSGEVVTVADLNVAPIAAAAVGIPPTTVVETKLVEQPITGETLLIAVEPEAARVEVEAPKEKEAEEDLGPETITYVVTYDVGKKEAGRPAEVRVERRRSSVEEEPGAELKPPEVEVAGVEAVVVEGPSAEVLVITPAPPKKTEAPDEETVKYVVEYNTDVVKPKFPRLLMKKVSKAPAPETPEARPVPTLEAQPGDVAEGHGIPVQMQVSETVNVDYDAVKITGPAVILEGPDVVVPSPYDERPEVAVAAAVAASAPPEPSALSTDGDTVTYVVNYDLPDVGVTRAKKLGLSLTKKDKETRPEEGDFAAVVPEAGEVPTPGVESTVTYEVTYEYRRTKKLERPGEPVPAKPAALPVTVDESIELGRVDVEKGAEVPAVEDTELIIVSPLAASAAVNVQPSPGLETEVVGIRGPEEIELPKIPVDRDVFVVQPLLEVEARNEVELPTVAGGVEEVETPAPPAGVSLELEKPSELDISMLPPEAEIPEKTAAEVRVGPAPEVEVEVPAVETVQEAAAPPETETVTFIVHYEEPTVGAKPSPDDVTLSFRKKRRADEIRILLRPLHDPLAVDDVTSPAASGVRGHHVVVAIDIGTTFSGYAFTLAGKTSTKDRQDEDGEDNQQQQQQQQQHSTVSIACYLAYYSGVKYKVRDYGASSAASTDSLINNNNNSLLRH